MSNGEKVYVPGKVRPIETLTIILVVGILGYFVFETTIFGKTFEMPEIILIVAGILTGIGVHFVISTIFWRWHQKIKDPMRKDSLLSLLNIKTPFFLIFFFIIIYLIFRDDTFDNFRTMLFLSAFSGVFLISNMAGMYRGWVRKGRHIGPSPFAVMAHNAKRNLSEENIRKNVREGLKTNEQKRREKAAFVWECPRCKYHNYEDVVKFEVKCRRCHRHFSFDNSRDKERIRVRKSDSGMPPMSKGWWGNFDEYEWRR